VPEKYDENGGLTESVGCERGVGCGGVCGAGGQGNDQREKRTAPPGKRWNEKTRAEGRKLPSPRKGEEAGPGPGKLGQKRCGGRGKKDGGRTQPRNPGCRGTKNTKNKNTGRAEGGSSHTPLGRGRFRGAKKKCVGDGAVAGGVLGW